jgi:hypothetical protein
MSHLAGWSRRRFLQVGSCSALGIGLSDVLCAESQHALKAPRATGVILIWLGGGPSTIDMWDPKPDAPEHIRGEFRSIPTSVPGIHFSEHMPQTARILDRCVLIRSLHHNIPDHVPGAQYMITGNKPQASLEHPSLGSLAARLLRGSRGMPPYFTMGEAPNSGAGFLGAAFNPFKIATTEPQMAVNLDGVTLPEGMSLQALESRRRILNVFDRQFQQTHAGADIEPTLSKFQQEAHDILTSNRIANSFDLSAEPESVQQLYGMSDVGRNALIARRLIESGARFVTLGTSGWDTHVGNFTALRGLLPPLDQALAALVVDLEQRGMLEKTLVVCGGEFGRTPYVNGAAGRDHWARALSFFMSGGGLKRGYVHGSTDARGFDPSDAPCAPDDLAATILTLLGIPGDYRIQTMTGRPIDLVERGVPLADIIT